MKKNIHLFLALLGLVLVSACDRPKAVEGGAMIIQTAELSIFNDGSTELANSDKVRTLILEKPEILSTTQNLTISLFRPTTKATTATVEVDAEAAKDYLRKKGLKHPILDAKHLEIPKEVVIPANAILSIPFAVKATLPEDAPFNTPYIFALTLKSIEGGAISKRNATAIFTIERFKESPQTVKAIYLTRSDYLEPIKSFSHDGDLTMECLVNVEKFRGGNDPGEANISTLMGIEGGTLLRFGDSGVPGNRMQASGQQIEFDFQENKWYHIAYVCKDGQVTFYVNGEQKSTYRKQSSLGSNWYIGRSYSDVRGLAGKLAEVRVWKKARTQPEIQESMYQVDPKTEGLLAYWKMNVATGSTIKDLTEQGYDLTQKGQDGKSGNVNVNIISLEEPVIIE